ALDGANSIEVLDEAVRLYGAPEIINSDQGCQYTSKDWTEACEKYGITMSMDGRGRAKDNIWIERFWRTLKMEYVYLNPAANVIDLREGISGFIEYYNHRRHHQGIDGKVPWELFLAVA
uniref:integrase core domain-containing protein n=1 Tax=uncultured Duncaniella sp. TaxID=2768039 RepID=UPI0025B6F641